MTKMLRRIARLESTAAATGATAKRISEDARAVSDKLSTMAANMDPSLSGIDAADWSRMSPAQHVAWAMRFGDWPFSAAIRACFMGASDAQQT